MRADDFPILERLSLARLTLEAGGFREPHWHANANELGYCVGGEVLVTVFADSNQHSSFTIAAGQMFFVPSGALHALENIGDARAELIIVFSHEQPQDFGFSGSVGMLTPNVMGNTSGLPADALAGLPTGPEDMFAGRVDGTPELTASAGYPNPLKLDLRACRHPVTAELGYVHTGRARMTVKSADGSVDTYTLAPGDVYFIPRAFPHHIENLADEETHFLVFFDQAEVRDIGYTGSAGAYPRRILAPTLGIPVAALPALPPMSSDLLIVEKRNPVDP